MGHPTDYIGPQRLKARVESRHAIASGNGKPLYRVELTDIRTAGNSDRLWLRKTVSDGKKWNDVPTGSLVNFTAKLDFDGNNRVQIFYIREVEVYEEQNASWWKLW